MIRLVVTTYDNLATVQDPYPPKGKAYNFKANTVTNIDLETGELERIAGQLYALAAAGFLTFTVSGTGGYSIAENADSPGNPVLDYGAPGTITAASMSLVITGENLLAGESPATASVLGDTVAGSVLLTRVTPGADGNLYDVEVIDSAGGGLTVALATVSGREVITIDLGGSGAETCTTVAALINNPASATYGVVYATVVGAGGTAITTVQAVTAFTGGTGTGMSVTLAGLPCTIVSVDDTAAPTYAITLATPNLAALSLATGDKLKLELRSGGKLTDATFDHA